MPVATYTGSIFVVCYVLRGSLIWQYVARPIEEKDLQAHFGNEYEDYRQQVRCWVPNVIRFRGASEPLGEPQQ